MLIIFLNRSLSLHFRANYLLVQVIVTPLAPKLRHSSILLSILSIWIISCILASPAVIFSQEVRISRLVEDVEHIFLDYSFLPLRCTSDVVCILVWPDGYQGVSALDYV